MSEKFLKGKVTHFFSCHVVDAKTIKIKRKACTADNAASERPLQLKAYALTSFPCTAVDSRAQVSVRLFVREFFLT